MTKLKFTFIFCCIVLCNMNAFSQTLSPKEKAVFDEVAYKRMQTGNYEVINKWIIPIRYKIYGDAAEYLIKEVDTTFKKLKALTHLDIEKTSDDDETNFLIVVGSKDIGLLSKNMAKYVNQYGGHTYRANKNSEITRVECLVMPEKYQNKQDVRAVIKKSIVKCMGFFNSTEAVPMSLFYAHSNGKLKVDDFDSHIISTMYLPTIKSGMLKEEVDKILLGN
jgi:hypothetical protein